MSTSYLDRTKGYIDELIKRMEDGASFLPYLEPGYANTASLGLPYNPISGKSYTGGNLIMCMTAQMVYGYSDSRWMTFKQAQSVGASVMKGAKGLPLRFVVSDTVEDDEGNDKNRMRAVPFYVFHASHIEGLPAPAEREVKDVQWRHDEAERLLQESGVPIIYEHTNAAFYRPRTDTIHMPEKDGFVSADAFYATALHELAHATGHASRLDRDMTSKPGTPGYAREEIIAETASMIMGSELGIGFDPSQHASYLKGYIAILKEDPGYLYKAATEAERICKHIGLERYQHQPIKQEREVDEVQAQPLRQKRSRTRTKEPERSMAMTL